MDPEVESLDIRYWARVRDGVIKIVFRLGDPDYVMARWDGHEWVDSWDTYRVISNGELDYERISEEAATEVMTRSSARLRGKKPKGPRVLISDSERTARAALVLAARRAWAGVRVPPGVEDIESFDSRDGKDAPHHGS